MSLVSPHFGDIGANFAPNRFKNMDKGYYKDNDIVVKIEVDGRTYSKTITPERLRAAVAKARNRNTISDGSVQ